MSDIVVFHDKIHGLDPNEYAEVIRQRWPEIDVTVARTADAKRREMESATVATGYQISSEIIEAANKLELFACTFAGTGHLPRETLKEADVEITSASGVHGPNVAEQVFAYVLADVRNLRRAWEQNKRSEWNHFQADELRGSTATVVGMGPIGKHIISRFNDFGVDTIGVRYTPEKGGTADSVVGFDETTAVAAESDYLVLACPLTETTRGLIDEQVFSALSTDGMVINIARGSVIDTEALVSALRSNDIRCAALDVTDPEPLPIGHPLWNLSNCLITPHNAGHTPAYWARCTDILAGAIGNTSLSK